MEKCSGMSGIAHLSVRGIIIIGVLLYHSKLFLIEVTLWSSGATLIFFHILFTYNCSVFVNKSN